MVAPKLLSQGRPDTLREHRCLPRYLDLVAEDIRLDGVVSVGKRFLILRACFRPAPEHGYLHVWPETEFIYQKIKPWPAPPA